jgi:hypothetical protein
MESYNSTAIEEELYEIIKNAYVEMAVKSMVEINQIVWERNIKVAIVLFIASCIVFCIVVYVCISIIRQVFAGFMQLIYRIIAWCTGSSIQDRIIKLDDYEHVGRVERTTVVRENPQKNPKTIEEMAKLADRHTEIKREAFPQKPRLGGNGRKEYPYTENKKNASQKWQTQGEVTCYHFNLSGHYSTNCPNKDGRKYGQKQEQYDVTCYNCNKQGH